MKRLLTFSVLALLAIAALVTGVAVAAGIDPADSPPPWSSRCEMEIRAYEDSSANLYCHGRRKPFGAIDAETGRVRFFIPR
jgi:hypothetical protein